MYPKLAGMTGTAMTEAAEFAEIYKLEVVEIPTNVPVARIRPRRRDLPHASPRRRAPSSKLIEECRGRQQPMLVGTVVDREVGAALRRARRRAGIPHNVLNARYHEQEAHIIAQAGRPGAVTIATNMAGRGTDIQLGGNVEMRVRQASRACRQVADEAQRKAELERMASRSRPRSQRDREIVRKAGGLYVIGTERHESRRIDNQLRGRSGRQGDPGASKFFLSLEDDLMRIFGNNKVLDWVQKKGLADGEAIDPSLAQQGAGDGAGKVEARNFEIRKNLLRFDNVMNDQRKVIYEERVEMMATDDVSDTVAGMRRDVIDDLVAPHHSRGRLRRAMGGRRAARKRCSACSASTCRSTSGPRKRASPTRRSRRA